MKAVALLSVAATAMAMPAANVSLVTFDGAQHQPFNSSWLMDLEHTACLRSAVSGLRMVKNGSGVQGCTKIDFWSYRKKSSYSWLTWEMTHNENCIQLLYHDKSC